MQNLNSASQVDYIVRLPNASLLVLIKDSVAVKNKYLEYEIWPKINQSSEQFNLENGFKSTLSWMLSAVVNTANIVDRKLFVI